MDNLNLEPGNTPEGLLNLSKKNDLAQGLGNSSEKHFYPNTYVMDTLNLEPVNTPKGLLNLSKK